MSGRDLIEAPQSRQVRSYHRAFNIELTIYTIGNNTRLWWPIPIRGVFWAGGILSFVVIVTNIVGMHTVLLSPDWAFLYIIIPVGLAWLFAGAKPEGRRLHVTLWSWLARAITGPHTVGGYRRLNHVDRMHGSKIRVRHTYVPNTPRNWTVPTAATLGVLFAFLLGAHILEGSPKAASRPKVVPTITHQAAAATLVRPAQTTRPTYPPAWGVSHIPVAALHAAPKHKIRAANKRHVTTHPRKQVVANDPSAYVPPRRSAYVPPTVTHTPTAPHVTYTPHISSAPRYVPQRAPVSSAPRPSPAPCYPGQLGC